MDTDTIEREKYLLEKETQQTTPYNVVRGPEFKNLIAFHLFKIHRIRFVYLVQVTIRKLFNEKKLFYSN